MGVSIRFNAVDARAIIISMRPSGTAHSTNSKKGDFHAQTNAVAKGGSFVLGREPQSCRRVACSRANARLDPPTAPAVQRGRRDLLCRAERYSKLRVRRPPRTIASVLFEYTGTRQLHRRAGAPAEGTTDSAAAGRLGGHVELSAAPGVLVLD